MFLALASDNPPNPHQVPLDGDYARLFALPDTEIIAYNVGYLGGDPIPRFGCDGMIAPDGALCPTVRVPGVALDEPQRRRLHMAVEAAMSEGDRHATVWCEFHPTLGFVFRDSFGYRGSVLVGLKCIQIAIEDGGSPRLIRNGVEFREICEDLGLAGCARDEEDAIHISRAATALSDPTDDLLTLGADAHPEWLDLPLSRLPDPAKRGLCAWHGIHTKPRAAGRYDCGAQGLIEMAEFSDCVARFPTTCDLSVHELARCVAAFSADICAPIRPSCEASKECLWQVLRD